MLLARPLSALCAVFASLVVVGCSESTSRAPGGDTESGGDTEPSPSGSDEVAGETLDHGGPLSAPFTCPVDAIQHEPRPAAIVLEQLRVAAGLDVLEERAVVEATDAAAGPELKPERAGAPCTTASDRPACEEAFAQLSSGGEVLRPPFDESDFMWKFTRKQTVRGYFLAYTKGDEVGAIASPSQLRALFPSVDTPATALVYANAAGYRVECQQLSGWIREETDGWVLLASRGHEERCSRTDVVLWLRRDGTFEERDTLENQNDPCT
ncbi:MAG: hypothetical protein KF795_16645 [Labilithrix sp.]|nr:hypothetical protein [Labilithrix sp.]